MSKKSDCAGARWLLKTEPNVYSYEDLVRDGRTSWDGVRNNQAALWLREMKLSERALIYHSNQGLAVVGVAEIVREAYPDPKDEKGRYVAVDIAPVMPLTAPVPLAAMKAHAALKDMRMFRQFRLSVTPVTAAEAAVICELGGMGS